MKIFSSFLLTLSLLLGNYLFAQDIEIVNLTTEYTKTPLGIDVEHPRFSWQMIAKNNGAYQSGYQILVTDEKGMQQWNSGKIKSDRSLNITYSGLPLKMRTRYTWQVSVWDARKKKHVATSWFETGLMNSNGSSSAWNGAQWIGGSEKDNVLYSQYLPVFKIDFTLQLDEASKSTAAGFIYGANDIRLMDKNKNLYQLQQPKDSSYIMVAIDIAPLKNNQPAQLSIYRSGYSRSDTPGRPFKSFAIPSSALNRSNQYERHVIYLSSVLGDTHIYIGGQERQNELCSLNLNPLGQGGDFIAFPVVGDIGFYTPKGQKAAFSNVRIRNYRSPSNILFQENLDGERPYKGIFADAGDNVSFENGVYYTKGGSNGKLTIADPSHHTMPMLRTNFTVSSNEVIKARLYVTSRGIYEFYINGRRIGDDYFNPGLTQYNHTHLYQTYDVTEDIRAGKNAMGAILAEGWWSGQATYMGEFWNFFGDQQSLLSQLIITYADGKEEIIGSDPRSWSFSADNPLIYAGFFQGEVYDATKEFVVEGWSTASFDDSKWQSAQIVNLENHISHDKRNQAFNMPMVDDYSEFTLKGQYGPTVKKVRELTAVAVEEVRPGVYLYDMGQNMAGVPRILLQGQKPGSRITLRFAEVKYPALPEYEPHVGTPMLENIRAAMAQDIYIAKGGQETISPRFTYHGYRYIELTGISAPLPLASVKGDVLSSINSLASEYRTSSPQVNKLWENITWSTLANFLSVPTDCPQRNERLGWSGDISVFSRTATYLANLPQFLRRHMQAMRDVQRADGRFTDVAPLGGGFGGVLWGSAGITVPWESYLQYGDTEMLTEHYPAMKDYVQYLVNGIDKQTGVLYEAQRKEWSSLGDWLSPEYDSSEKSLLWECYFIYDLEIMSKIALLLGKTEDAERFKGLLQERKIFFNKTYVNQDGTTGFRGRTIDTQCSYVLPLQFHAFNEDMHDKAVSHFTSTITRHNKTDGGQLTPPYSLMTGFIGTAWINTALSDNGHSELAYRLLQQTDYPSWLYPVTQGATTIWERLNSYTHTSGFGGNNRMNSFNHYSFGAVGAWMYSHSLGIQRDELSPAFKHFVLYPQPDPNGKMTDAKGYYDSYYGKIKSGWKLQGGKAIYTFTIPANTTATFYVRAHSLKSIKTNGRNLSKYQGVKFLGEGNGIFKFELPSGNYEVVTPNPNDWHNDLNSK